MIIIKELLQEGKASTTEVLNIFDSLPEVSVDFMLGRWTGGEIETDHPMDGMLKFSGWYGKVFETPEIVHPLVYFGKDKSELFAIDPSKVPMEMELPKSELLETLLHIGRPFIQTSDSKARLRMIEYRNKQPLQCVMMINRSLIILPK